MINWQCLLIVSALMMSSVSDVSAEVAHKPLVILEETNHGGGMRLGPWPYGLRYVLFDDGRVISSPDSSDRKNNLAPHFLIEDTKLTSPQAAADEIIDALQDVPSTMRAGANLMTDQGWTVLTVWSVAAQDYVTYMSYGYPCRAQGRSHTGTFDNANRSGTDPRFLSVCDRLSLYAPTAADPWQPQVLSIHLQKSSAYAERQIAWPTDWGPAPTKETAQARSSFCIKIADLTSDFSRRLVSDNWKVWAGAAFTTVWSSRKDGLGLEVAYWRYVMPGYVGGGLNVSSRFPADSCSGS